MQHTACSQTPLHSYRSVTEQQASTPPECLPACLPASLPAWLFLVLTIMSTSGLGCVSSTRVWLLARAWAFATSEGPGWLQCSKLHLLESLLIGKGPYLWTRKWGQARACVFCTDALSAPVGVNAMCGCVHVHACMLVFCTFALSEPVGLSGPLGMCFILCPLCPRPLVLKHRQALGMSKPRERCRWVIRYSLHACTLEWSLVECTSGELCRTRFGGSFGRKFLTSGVAACFHTSLDLGLVVQGSACQLGALQVCLTLRRMKDVLRCVFVRARARVCVCVCVREGGREGVRGRGRERVNSEQESE